MVENWSFGNFDMLKHACIQADSNLQMPMQYEMCACPLRNVWVLLQRLTLRPQAHVTEIPHTHTDYIGTTHRRSAAFISLLRNRAYTT